ncbi:MAG: hypothetical protein NTW32_14440 [Chloroflexi bacterium]|nr:hypothetical protein [Chloroflexota bacterium]
MDLESAQPTDQKQIGGQPAGTEPVYANTLPSQRPVRRGESCPRCGLGRLDYNGLIDLECPVCGYSEGSGAGCT